MCVCVCVPMVCGLVCVVCAYVVRVYVCSVCVVCIYVMSMWCGMCIVCVYMCVCGL